MSSAESTTPTTPTTAGPPPGPPTGVPAANPGIAQGDWPAQAADAIVEVVGKVRDSTTGPLLTAMRGVVYGTAIVVLAMTALVMFTIGSVRALDAYLPGEIWSAYLLLGTIYTGIGLFLWSRRYPATSS
jgi:hypothetical protein